jgi:CheY-like chemotaxis protein
METGCEWAKGLPEIPQIATVLVVDDDPNWCYVTRLLLEDEGVGQQILTAPNGLEALKKLQTMAANGENLPELIFLDIKMPVMDGFEFLEEIAKAPALNLTRTRIFIYTSSFLPKDKERARQYPVSGFITKPLTEEKLRDIPGWHSPSGFSG